MRAAAFYDYSGPSALSVTEAPVPVPRPGEVLVRTAYASINAWDAEVLRGTPLVNRLLFGVRAPSQKARILGADLSGIVEAVGLGVKCFAPGDRVCADNWDRWGAFAEFVCVKAEWLATVPEDVDLAVAAALPQAGMMARQGLMTTGRLMKGERVLVIGAGGGAGGFAVQIARAQGAAAITGMDFIEKHTFIRGLGADSLIDPHVKDPFAAAQKFDLILDTIGLFPVKDVHRVLAPNGRHVMVGAPVWRALSVAMGFNHARRAKIMATRDIKDLVWLLEAVRTQQITPMIDEIFPLAEIAAAYRRFEANAHCGKILIDVRSMP